MSFNFYVILSHIDEMSKEDLRRWQPTDSKIELHPIISFSSKRTSLLSIEKRGQGSGGLLTDNADPDKPYWDMNVELLPEIGHLIKLLRQNTKSGFVLQAHWSNEYSSRQIEISVDEMIQIIEKGLVGTRTKYIIQ
jgi:hypothetical protein